MRRRRRLVPQGLPPARAPASALSWVVRFESVNYRARVWLNGQPIGANRGAYLPFELRLPRSLLKRGGVNRLVVRVDSRRQPTDFPPSGLDAARACRPAAGGTTAGSCARSTCARSTASTSTPSSVRPDLPVRAPAPATVRYRVTRAQLRRQRRSASRVTGRFGGAQARRSAARASAPRRFATFTQARPRRRTRGCGRRRSPTLYDARSTRARRASAHASQRYTLQTGIRSIKVVGGQLLPQRPAAELPRRRRCTRTPRQVGFAIDNARRAQQHRRGHGARRDGDPRPLPAAPLLRTSWPTARASSLWSEIPVYAVKTQYLKQRARPQARRASELEANIIANGNHPSIIVWSIGNELSAAARPGAGLLHPRARRARPRRSTRRARSASPSPATRRSAARPSTRRSTSSASTSTSAGTRARTARSPTATLLSDYLDSRARLLPERRRSWSPSSAPRPTATGPVEEKGTYEFQQDFVNYHLGVYATKPWLSRRDLLGAAGVPRAAGLGRRQPAPDPPIHQKGVVALRRRAQEAARAFDLQRRFARRTQFGAAAPALTVSRRPHGATLLAAHGPTRPPRSPSPRATPGGSRATRRLRREGLVPGRPLRRRRRAGRLRGRRARAAPRARRRAAPCSSCRSTAQSTPAVLKDAQRHPVRGETMHVDLLRVDLNVADPARRSRSSSSAPRTRPGVKEGGVLEHVTREVNVEALPNDIPESIQLDVSAMEINDTLSRCRARRARGRHAARRPRGDHRRHLLAAAPRGRGRGRGASRRRPGVVGEGEGAEGSRGRRASRPTRRRLRRRVAARRDVRRASAARAGRLAGRRARQPRRAGTRARRTTSASRSRTRSRALGPAEAEEEVRRPARPRAARGIGGPARRAAAAADVHERGGRVRRPGARRAEGAARARARRCTTRSTCPSATSAPRVGGGLAGHNGLKSLRRGLGSPDFARVRVGVGRPDSTDPEIVAALRPRPVHGADGGGRRTSSTRARTRPRRSWSAIAV